MAQKKINVILPAQSTSSITSTNSVGQANVTLTTSSSVVSTPVGAEVSIIQEGPAGPAGPAGPLVPHIVFETGNQTIVARKTFTDGITINGSSLTLINSDFIVSGEATITGDFKVMSGVATIIGNMAISGDVDSPYLKTQSIKFGIIFG